MTPTLNVNLKQCTHDCGTPVHALECTGQPVLIPCPLPPKVEFTVRLGECDCNAQEAAGRSGMYAEHLSRCPAHLTPVTCIISGETWEGSEVAECVAPEIPLNVPLLAVCRERWALVKALVLGWPGKELRASANFRFAPYDVLANTITRRDAVFAALADMARAEEATCTARDAVRKARGLPLSKPLAHELRESAIELGDYVSHLISQVGAL